MTARARHVAAFLDDLSRPGPEAQRFASMVENNREWFAQLRADRERESREDRHA